jgi:hypothetical protein
MAKTGLGAESDAVLLKLAKKAERLMLEGLADEVFAPRQQREQLDPEIGNEESSKCDRRYAHKCIPDYGRHAGMNGIEYDDVRQVHAIAHARKIVYQSP